MVNGDDSRPGVERAAPGADLGPGDEAGARAGGYDCGKNALFFLLKTQNPSLTYERLDATLPPPKAGGYSLAQLARASHELGVELVGVQVAKGDPSVTGPVIALLSERPPNEGHFVFLRPISDGSRLIQVLDPPYPPVVVDAQRLTQQTAWRGSVLRLKTGWDRVADFSYVGIAFAVVIVLLLITKTLRGSRRPDGRKRGSVSRAG